MTRLRIAIVHYHLRPGGVTRVIEHTLHALAEHPVNPVVLCGETTHTTHATRNHIRIVQGLGYADHTGREHNLARSLQRAATEILGGEPDVWHFHNHSLGKNTAVPAAAAAMAADGKPLLLQMHDFPEDGRPDNYALLRNRLADKLNATLYPCGGRVHYAAINQRDHSFLSAAGLSKERLHYLPNAVALPGPENLAETNATDRPIYLYVTRAIRRKNLGEILLWAALARNGERFQISRAPINPAARPVYEQWVHLAQALALPVEFEAGEKHPGTLGELMRNAHALITASVAEGFGLAFLEPWLARRALVGRNIPEITPDFTPAGINLAALYSTLNLPLEWIGLDHLRTQIHHAMAKSMAAYGRTLTPAAVEHAVSAARNGEYIDFGRLDEKMQQNVIRRVAQSPEEQRLLQPHTLEQNPLSRNEIEHNRAAVLNQFSLDRYGKRLMQIYSAIINTPPETPATLNADRLLDRFLAPERFLLLRTA